MCGIENAAHNLMFRDEARPVRPRITCLLSECCPVSIPENMMLEFVGRAAYLGIMATVMPGPQQAFAINSALATGWRKSLILGIAPFLADLPVIVMVFLVLRGLPPDFLRGIQILGGLFLLYLAYTAFRSYRAGTAIDSGTHAGSVSSQRLLQRAILMNWLSPSPYVFWSSVHGPVVVGLAAQSLWSAFLYVFVFYGVFFVGIALTVWLASRLGQFSPAVTRKLILVTIIALAVFGLWIIAQGIGGAIQITESGG
jgi:threonine/homoserine/homoserine lactone efflux protein